VLAAIRGGPGAVVATSVMVVMVAAVVPAAVVAAVVMVAAARAGVGIGHGGGDAHSRGHYKAQDYEAAKAADVGDDPLQSGAPLVPCLSRYPLHAPFVGVLGRESEETASVIG
jgi:hypothetical protein